MAYIKYCIYSDHENSECNKLSFKDSLCKDHYIDKIEMQLTQQKAMLDEAVKVINMLPISADPYTEKTRGAFLDKVKNEQ